MSPSSRTIITPVEALTVTGIVFGISIFYSVNAVFTGFNIGKFTDNSLLWLIANELVLGAAALLFLHARQYAVGSLFPTPTLRGSAAGLGLFATAWLVGWLCTLPFSPGQTEQPIERMVQNATLSLSVNVLMAMVNSVYEEVFLLAFMLRGLRGFGLSTALGVMLLVRVLYHLYQGPLGAVWVLGAGLVFGVYYIRSGTLWPPVFAHMLWDIVPFWMG